MRPARRDAVVEPRAALAVGLHVGEIAPARAQRFHHRALVRVFDVDRELLERLALHAVDFAHHDARPRHRQLEAFAAHVFDQDREMQFAAARDQERIGVARLLDAQRHVGQHFLGEAIAQVARRHVLAFAAGERRRVDLEVHRQRRLVDQDRRQRFRGVDRRERRADRQFLDTRHQHDVADFRRLNWHALHALERKQLANLRLLRHFALGQRSVQHRDFLPRGDAPAADAADAEPADVARIVERGNLQLERPVGIADRRGNVLDHGLEQRSHVRALWGHAGLRDIDVHRRPAIQRGRVDDREVELILARPELVEQLEGLVDDPLRTRAGAIDLVDHDDRLEALLQRLHRDEARLRHRAFDRVDQQQHAIDHAQDRVRLRRRSRRGPACRRC